MGNWPRTAPKVHVVNDQPTQDNTLDCGIFVCKYVDYYVRGNIDITKERWSSEDLAVFRSRIAYELYKCQVEDISINLLMFTWWDYNFHFQTWDWLCIFLCLWLLNLYIHCMVGIILDRLTSLRMVVVLMVFNRF